MRKFFALFLTMCMFMVGTCTSVFAAENKQEANIEATSSTNDNDISMLNTDYWKTPGPVVIGNTTFQVFPGKGENLKIHLYLYSSNKITISVQPEGGSTRTVATWNSKGHHWADLVRGTNGRPYWITISGSTIADGGVYSEP